MSTIISTRIKFLNELSIENVEQMIKNQDVYYSIIGKIKKIEQTTIKTQITFDDGSGTLKGYFSNQIAFPYENDFKLITGVYVLLVLKIGLFNEKNIVSLIKKLKQIVNFDQMTNHFLKILSTKQIKFMNQSSQIQQKNQNNSENDSVQIDSILHKSQQSNTLTKDLVFKTLEEIQNSQSNDPVSIYQLQKVLQSENQIFQLNNILQNLEDNGYIYQIGNKQFKVA